MGSKAPGLKMERVEERPFMAALDWDLVYGLSPGPKGRDLVQGTYAALKSRPSTNPVLQNLFR